MVFPVHIEFRDYDRGLKYSPFTTKCQAMHDSYTQCIFFKKLYIYEPKEKKIKNLIYGREMPYHAEGDWNDRNSISRAKYSCLMDVQKKLVAEAMKGG